MLLKCPWITSFESRVPAIAISFSESLSWASISRCPGVMPLEGYIQTWQSWWCSRLKDMQTDRLSQIQGHPRGWKGHSKSIEGTMWHLVYTDTLCRQEWQKCMLVRHEAAVTRDKRDTYSYKFMVWIGYSELRTQTTDKILSGWGR